MHAGVPRFFVCKALCDFSKVSIPAGSEPVDATGSSRVRLRDRSREVIGVEDYELVHRFRPVFRRAAPVGGDVLQRRSTPFGSRLDAGEIAAGFDDAALPRVDALDGVRGIDHPAHRPREGDEWDQARAGAVPGSDDGGQLLAPRSLLEGRQRGLGALGHRTLHQVIQHRRRDVQIGDRLCPEGLLALIWHTDPCSS